MAVDFEILKLLLNASDKESLAKVCTDAFNFKKSSSRDDTNLVSLTCKTLTTEEDVSTKILLSLQYLEKQAVLEGLRENTEVEKLFPSDFQNNLKKFLTNLIVRNVQSWKEKLLCHSVFAPRLVDFDWRVDVVASSNSQSQLSMPTCLLQLQLQDAASHAESESDGTLKDVKVEMTGDNLDTLIRELTKIKDQLTSLASKSEQ